MSTCPIYQKRGDQLVPVLVIDEAPSSDPSAAGHLVDSNGIQSALDALEAKIPTDPIDTGDFMHLSGNKKETATGSKTFTDDVFMDKCLYVDDAIEVGRRIDCRNFWGVRACNFYYDTVSGDKVISPGSLYESAYFTSDYGINIYDVSFADNIEPGDYRFDVTVGGGNLGTDRKYKKLTVVVNYTPSEGANLRIRWINNESLQPSYTPITWVGSSQPSTFIPGTNIFEFLLTKDAIYGRFIVQNPGNYLPLAGGTMTGTIQVRSRVPGDLDSEPLSIQGTDSAKELCISANLDDPHRGPFLALYGTSLTYGETKAEGVVDYSDRAGYFIIGARRPDPSDSSTNISHSLEGYPDGRLFWGGKPVEYLMESEFVATPEQWNYRYYKYSNGLLIYTGWARIAAGSPFRAIPLTIPYIDDGYRVLSNARTSVGDVLMCCGERSSTWFDLHRRRCTDLAYNFDVHVDFAVFGIWKRPFNQ